MRSSDLFQIDPISGVIVKQRVLVALPICIVERRRICVSRREGFVPRKAVMATNIEQIFRSFVVTKFREIQEQQFGSGKIGNQHNGEINTSGQVNTSEDTVQSIESLQNDSLVQKIEQVLSEVLGTEPRYKSGDGEDIERNNSRSTKRGLSEEVQDEIPRKKSKKDKKHKDKKKKKKERRIKKRRNIKSMPKK